MPESPPTIVAPITACTDGVRLQGQYSGQTVVIAAGPPLQEAVVFTGVASGPDEEFVLTRELQPGESVVAWRGQPGGEYRNVLVEPPPDPTELTALAPDSHLHACASCVAIGGAFPGAHVQVESPADGLLADGRADADGVARLRLAQRRLLDGEHLRAMQRICTHTGGPTDLPAPDRPYAQDWRVDAPVIRGPLVECDRAIRVEGVVPGAMVRLYRDGAESASACFDYPDLWFKFADPLREGERVEVDQVMRGCEIQSDRGAAPPVGARAAPPAPTILGPLCKGQPSILVTGLRYGARVKVVQTAQDFARSLVIAEVEAWDETCEIQLFRTADPAQGRYLMASQTMCGLESDPSTREEIKARRQPRPPVVQGPIFECGRRVRVGGITRGARVEVLMSTTAPPGWRRIASSIQQGPVADIRVAPGLVRGHQVMARQIACGQPAQSQAVTVQPKGRLDPPSIEECGDRLIVRGVVPGARVEIYRNDKFLTDLTAAASVASVRIGPSALKANDVLKARQALCDELSDFGHGVALRQAVEKGRFTWVSTDWVSRLTGTPSSFGAGIKETDLGIVIDHSTGDGLLYFFFGDTGLTDDADDDDFPDNADCIGWTQLASPGTQSVALEFAHDTDDGDPVPKPYSIAGISQDAFEVPSGGFSHAGKLFVFATTDHYTDVPITQGVGKDENFMGRAVLTAAPTARDMFHVVAGHAAISDRSREGAGGFKFINIAPWKIRNDDLAGLPSNAQAGGEGLIIIGSGRYRESRPCLAYVPLRAGEEPAFGDWRYLSGFDASDALLEACGTPRWSEHQEDAIFLFDDTASPQFAGNAGIVGELSIAFFDGPAQWVLLYGGVVLRSAPKPWGPWTPPVVLFDPGRDHPRLDDAADPRPHFLEDGFGIYGPYVVPRWSHWDDSRNELTLHYAMSTWRPYQVMLMKTVVAFDCSYREGISCPTR